MGQSEPTLAPVHAALDCAASFVSEDVAEEEQADHSLPLAVLDFDRYPQAAALFGTLLDASEKQRCIAMVEPWVALADEEVDAYDAPHSGHPMIRFLITAERYQEEPIPALSFRVCVQHEAGFMQQVTRFDEMGILSAGPQGVDPR